MQKRDVRNDPQICLVSRPHAALDATVGAKLHAGGFTAKKTGYRHAGLNARADSGGALDL
jgi:hypothetical protein